MAISIGALVEHPEILDLAKQRCCKIYAPSGAIAGLDGIKSASAGKIDSVIMTTRKPLEALEGSPYLNDKGIKGKQGGKFYACSISHIVNNAIDEACIRC